MLSSLRRLPSSASTATLYRLRRTSVLALGLKDIVALIQNQNQQRDEDTTENEKVDAT